MYIYILTFITSYFYHQGKILKHVQLSKLHVHVHALHWHVHACTCMLLGTVCVELSHSPMQAARADDKRRMGETAKCPKKSVRP